MVPQPWVHHPTTHPCRFPLTLAPIPGYPHTPRCRAPFASDQQDETAITANIMAGTVSFPTRMGDQAQTFISGCLSRHPGDRPSVLECVRHPWVRWVGFVPEGGELGHCGASSVTWVSGRVWYSV